MALLQNVIAKGTHSARPAAGSAGVLYYETDTYKIFRDNGSSWDELDFTAAIINQGTMAVAQLPVMVASGGSHAAGIVPDPGSSAGSTHFLREDATWAVSGGGSAAMVNLGENILGSPASSISISSLSGSYRHLFCTLVGAGSSTTDNAILQLNADTGSNYMWEDLVASSSATVANAQSTTSIRLGELAGTDAATAPVSAFSFWIFDYARTTFRKNVVVEGSYANADSGASAHWWYGAAGQWKSTSAVNAVAVKALTGNFVTGSVLTIWGVV